MNHNQMIDLIKKIDEKEGMETLLDKNEMTSIFEDYKDELEPEDVKNYLSLIKDSSFTSSNQIIERLFNITIDLKYILTKIKSESGFETLLDVNEMESVFEDYKDVVDKEVIVRYLTKIPNSDLKTIDEIIDSLKYKIEFVSEGKVISTLLLNKGDVILAPKEIPNKKSTKSTEYQFVKWNGFNDGDVAISDKVYEAIFSEKEIEYSIVFVSEDKTISTMKMAFGQTIIAPTAPSKPSNHTFTYKFKEWKGFTEGMTVSGNKTFEAVFESIPTSKGNSKITSCTRPIGMGLFHDCGFQMYFDTKNNIMRCNICAHILNNKEYKGQFPPHIRIKNEDAAEEYYSML